MDMTEPVWITGVGAATPLGSGLDEIEANLLAGRSGVSLVTRFPTDDYPSRIAAQLSEPLRAPESHKRRFARPGLCRPATSRPACALVRGTGAGVMPGSGTRIARRVSGWSSASAPSGCSTGKPTA